MAVLSFFVFACGEPSEEEVSPSDPVGIVRSWTEVTSDAGFTGRSGHTSAVFDGALWVIGGFTGSGVLNDVWKSTDGKNWNRVTTTGTVAAGVRMIPKMRCGSSAAMTVPEKNDVWKSTDGISWDTGNSHKPVFPDGRVLLPRCLAARCGLSAAMTVPEINDSRKNDVWKSTTAVPGLK
ncbi:hypothetical protein CHS0354_018473 [Potamilus streckersoni]|uniref:Galactose oxidase n=1 Tax=Potamilus streckersoni TaxID=2493646 RepID=A0AAE0TAM9_9BIVA|nr:hypothetical protein CHS0354_018473 [Potamilus streckersoni]